MEFKATNVFIFKTLLHFTVLTCENVLHLQDLYSETGNEHGARRRVGRYIADGQIAKQRP